MSKVYKLINKGHEAFCLENFTVGESSLEEVFPFLRQKHHTISLVGGGGKTTLMYELAAYSAASGNKTLVTTSTHIWKPEGAAYICTEKAMQERWNASQYAVVGKRGKDHKLEMLDRMEWDRYRKLADMVLIEADGAKSFPSKVPAATEPVILPETDVVIGIMGLDAIGQPVQKVCFRLEEAKKMLNIEQNHVMTVEDAVQILTSVQGTRKSVENRQYYIVLNKCDTADRMEIGRRLLFMLKEQGIEQAVLTSLL
jgi:probable selenium-dependent hydroxylase accessory protein YqeC